jgi:hypothetical protein
VLLNGGSVPEELAFEPPIHTSHFLFKKEKAKMKELRKSIC